MQLRQLQYFVAVAEQLNFHKAAEELYVTQPLLSKQIAELEHEIGYPLFIRNTRSVRLTPAGEELLKEAENLIHQSSMVIKTVRNVASGGNVSGVLKVGYEDSFDRILMSRALNRLRKKHPHIELNLQQFSFNRITKALNENTIDIGLILLPDKKLSPKLSCKVLSEDHLVLCAAKCLIQHKDQLDEYLELLQHEAMYLLEKNSKGISLINRFCTALDLAPEFHFVDTVRAMLLYAEAGAGVAVVPRTVFDAYNSELLCCVDILSEVSFICMTAAWPTENQNQLRELLLEEFETHPVHCAQCDNEWCRMYAGDHAPRIENQTLSIR